MIALWRTQIFRLAHSATRLPVQVKKHMCCLSSFLFLCLSAYWQKRSHWLPHKESTIAVNPSHRFMCYAPWLGREKKRQATGVGLAQDAYLGGFGESSYIVSLSGSVNWNIMRFEGIELYGKISFEAEGNNDPTSNRRAV